jgi:hypothetical protein
MAAQIAITESRVAANPGLTAAMVPDLVYKGSWRYLPIFIFARS